MVAGMMEASTGFHQNLFHKHPCFLKCSKKARHFSRGAPLTVKLSESHGSSNGKRDWALGCRPRRDGPSTDDISEEEKKQDVQIDVALTTATSAGITGSLALVLGYLLHVDPMGNFHFDMQDTLVGLSCFIPSFLFKSGLVTVLATTKDAELTDRYILNKYKKAKQGEEDKSRTRDEKDSGPSDMQIVKESIKHYCGYRAMGSLGLKDIKENPLFLGLDFLGVLSQEMLFRAVLLTYASLWVSDRLYQAGAEDFFFGNGVPTLDAAKWLIGGVWFATFIIKIVRSLSKAPGKPKELTKLVKYSLDKSQSSVVTEFLEQSGEAAIVKEIVTVGVVASSINSLDALLEMVGSTSSYLLTGNLWSAVGPAALSSVYGIWVSSQGVQLFADSLKQRQISQQKSNSVEDSRARVDRLKECALRYLATGELPAISATARGADNPLVAEATDSSPSSQDSQKSNQDDPQNTIVSFSGHILAMMIRQEISIMNTSIRRAEQEGRDATSLRESRSEVQKLLEQVEVKLTDSPEPGLGTYLHNDNGSNGNRKSSDSSEGGSSSDNETSR